MNAIYVVAISKDVAESAGGQRLCCGYHSYMDSPSTGHRLLVGNTDQCPASCNFQSRTPNGIPGVDGMINVLAHGIVEAVSDPELKAWYDAKGDENADKCAWNFGAIKNASNGAKYNVDIGGRNFLIQQNWDPSLQVCALSASSTTTKTTTTTTKTSTTTTKTTIITTKITTTTSSVVTSSTTTHTSPPATTNSNSADATTTTTTNTISSASTTTIPASESVSSTHSSLTPSSTTSTSSSLPISTPCLSPPQIFTPLSNITHIMRIHGQSSGAGGATAPITYRYGKPVLTSTVTVNIIFYGSWATTAMNLTKAFVSGLGSTPWYGVNKRYYYATSSTSTKTYVSNLVLGGTVVDAYSQGFSLSGTAMSKIIQNQLNLNTFAVDTNAIYIVAISKDVAEASSSGSSFCGAYCGYHSYMTLPCSGRRIKYSMVGNTDRCPSACNAQTKTPNGIPGVDGMLSVLAHEIVETVSDPERYDSSGNENADKCAWTFGTTKTDSSGANSSII